MAIIADLATFRVFYPEFDPVPDATVVIYLDLFNEELDEVYWRTCKPKAVLARSAHEIALSQNRQSNAQETDAGQVVTAAGSGAISSATAGAITAGYTVGATLTSGSDADVYFYKTEYGQQYLLLKRQCLPLAILAGCVALAPGEFPIL